MPQGTVKMFGGRFGFITPDGGGGDVFFHESALREGEVVEKGSAVSYEMGVDPKSGKDKATQVDLL